MKTMPGYVALYNVMRPLAPRFFTQAVRISDPDLQADRMDEASRLARLLRCEEVELDNWYQDALSQTQPTQSVAPRAGTSATESAPVVAKSSDKPVEESAKQSGEKVVDEMEVDRDEGGTISGAPPPTTDDYGKSDEESDEEGDESSESEAPIAQGKGKGKAVVSAVKRKTSRAVASKTTVDKAGRKANLDANRRTLIREPSASDRVLHGMDKVRTSFSHMTLIDFVL